MLFRSAGKLEGIVSRETQLSTLPQNIVGNAAEELERIRREAMDDEQLPYVKTEDTDAE